MILPINTYSKNKKILTTSSIFVQKSEWQGYKPFAQNLAETLDSHKEGIGLAANQIWKYFSEPAPRIFAMRNEKDQIVVIINPRITYIGKTIKAKEGCLSLPGIEINKKRFEYCKVDCIDVETWSKFSFYLKNQFARVAQHEMDHLVGKLITTELQAKTTK